MPWIVPAEAAAEFAAAFLQGAITLALALLCAFLYRNYRKPYFLVWAVAWLLYSLRIGAITSFLVTEERIWLFWHQVTTGWTALALLLGALVFAQGVTWRPAFVGFLLFPVVWSWIAIYTLDNFLLAAGPAVLFLSAATILTAWAFERHHRQVQSTASRFLAVAFALWGLHHLDYPFLRAQGVWTPWGYYLDIAFVLAAGLGILLLVQEDLLRGLHSLSSLSAVLQSERGDDDVMTELLERVRMLPAVRGSALVLLDRNEALRVHRSIGSCEDWVNRRLDADAAHAVGRAISTGRPAVSSRAGPGHRVRHPYIAALPIFSADRVIGAIVAAGRARDPFAALDDSFLVALGQQIGAALANVDLTRRLGARTAQLEELASRMVRQHEDERRRLSRELHDETAQVLAALNMQIGVARETAGPRAGPPLDRALELIRDGIRSIRRVTDHLRPTLLDDLGLRSALRGLVDDFRNTQQLDVTFTAPDRLPVLSDDAELALFRALQEALSNVAHHAGASRVAVRIAVDDGILRMRVHDNGRGASPTHIAGAALAGRTGLVGMRERVAALGGDCMISSGEGVGTELVVTLPLSAPAESA